ncbi:hypothetical protein FD754_019465 [Muntiacus muntjak]|uniref:Uncharacterized protein n=1 Tax=Muntiacus muntjak TaxID=9888 RepID=A0A5N3V0K6_MUNMU|nr:hypothetical protein FD754_019465 [Muntiacus muntjak]
MAAQGEPQVHLLPCLLLPRQKWSWTQPWQHSMSRFRGCSDNCSPG